MSVPLMDAVAANIVDIEQELNGYLAQIKEHLKNKDLPLADRWNAFMKVAKYLPKDTYSDGHSRILDDNCSLYDDFYMDRGHTQSYTDMYETILERNDDDYSDTKYSEQNIADWQEAVLASGDGSFTYDW